MTRGQAQALSDMELLGYYVEWWSAIWRHCSNRRPPTLAPFIVWLLAQPEREYGRIERQQLNEIRALLDPAAAGFGPANEGAKSEPAPAPAVRG